MPQEFRKSTEEKSVSVLYTMNLGGVDTANLRDLTARPTQSESDESGRPNGVVSTTQLQTVGAKSTSTHHTHAATHTATHTCGRYCAIFQSTSRASLSCNIFTCYLFYWPGGCVEMRRKLLQFPRSNSPRRSNCALIALHRISSIVTAPKLTRG